LKEFDKIIELSFSSDDLEILFKMMVDWADHRALSRFLKERNNLKNENEVLKEEVKSLKEAMDDENRIFKDYIEKFQIE
jgi:cell shape-determining protein MreC